MNSGNITLTLPNGDKTSLEEIKEMVRQQKGVDIGNMQLFYDGKLLRWDGKLDEYLIPKDAVINMIAKWK